MSGSVTNFPIKCDSNAKNDPKTHCGLYTVDWGSSGMNRDVVYNLVDSFRKEEDQKRVKISDLKFYITGDKEDNGTARKVTLKMTLELIPRV